jgi:hypothetical protein
MTWSSSLLVQATLLAVACTAVPATLLSLRAERLASGTLVRLPVLIPEGLAQPWPNQQLGLDLKVEPAPDAPLPIDRAGPGEPQTDPLSVPWQPDGWVALKPGQDGVWQITRAQDVRFPANAGEVLLRTGYGRIGPSDVPLLPGGEPAPSPGPTGQKPLSGFSPEAFRLSVNGLEQVWIGPDVPLAGGRAIVLLRVGADARATFAGIEQRGRLVVSEGPL